jgi:hypothetical protein
VGGLSGGPSGFHIGELSLDFLVLSLGRSESKALVSESIWIVTIFWAFGTPSLEWSLLEEVDWVSFGDLGEALDESESWAGSVSVVVFSSGEGG